MCGILSILNKQTSSNSEDLLAACKVIRHRGPDDEGFLTWTPGEQPVVLAGEDTSETTLLKWRYDRLMPGQRFKVGFGHRRLSILDLSPAGHQPMQYRAASLSITFNGEVYNYLEIKAELEKEGHQFVTSCDTEVILHAWQQWGIKCLDKFNGMFAFVILDHARKELFAVRDRFGVKPLFYFENEQCVYLASEMKQIRTMPGYKLELNMPVVRQYLATGAVNHSAQTFDKNIQMLPPGHYIYANVGQDDFNIKIEPWYQLKPKTWSGNYDQAVGEFRNLLTDSVKLRLRSDVTVGSCLSGGLDSSSIVCIASDLLKAGGSNEGQETVTACYEEARFDEWKFAEEVVKKTNARPHRTFPNFKQLVDELDDFLWHQDEPTGSTSQFSQWAVFKKTHEVGLKVMIDGQGADEQLAGYGGNDMAFYNGLFRKAKFSAMLEEAQAYKKQKGHWPKGFILGALKHNSPLLGKMLPQNLALGSGPDVAYVTGGEKSSIYSLHAGSLQENLLRQIYHEPLPALLRYEDHNSMAWSVESRTPFMDFRLMEFTLGLPERFVYKNGIRKTILRDAMHNIIPEAIENRKDKMGFVTPEEVWLRTEGREWFTSQIDKACQQFDGSILNAAEVKKYFEQMADGQRKFDFMPWRIVCFYRWFNSVGKNRS